MKRRRMFLLSYICLLCEQNIKIKNLAAVQGFPLTDLFQSVEPAESNGIFPGMNPDGGSKREGAELDFLKAGP